MVYLYSTCVTVFLSSNSLFALEHCKCRGIEIFSRATVPCMHVPSYYPSSAWKFNDQASSVKEVAISLHVADLGLSWSPQQTTIEVGDTVTVSYYQHGELHVPTYTCCDGMVG